MPSRRAWLLSALPPRGYPQNSDSLAFLEIETDSGITGLGEGSISERVDIVEQAIQWFAPYLVGKEPAGIEDHWNRNYYQKPHRWKTPNRHYLHL